LAGSFPKLEAELGGLIAGGTYEGPGRSPDRADAMVWALTVLSETRSGLPRVTRL
jgi:phage terminase large subunit-like protein